MRIFSKYVFRQAAGSFALIMVSLTGIVWIALALRQFNVVTSQGQDTWMLIKMTSLAVPNLMAVIAPFSFLIAALHTLNRLNTDSELIVISASGAKVWTAARPLLLLALLVSIFLAFVSHFAQPWSMRQLRDYMVQVRSDLLTQVIQPGRFTSPESGLMFHIRDRDANGELLGLVFDEFIELLLLRFHGPLAGLVLVDDFLRSERVFALHGGGEDAKQGVVVAGGDGIEFVVVALGAADGESEPRGADRVHAVDKLFVARLGAIDACFAIGERVAQEAGGDQLIGGGVGKQIAGQLFDGEAIEGEVAIEGLDHPVAVGPDFAVVVDVNAVGVAVARCIEPIAGAVFAIVRRFEVAVNHVLVGLGRGVGEVLLDLGGFGREAGEVERNAADEGAFVGFGRGGELLGFEFGEDEVVDGVAGPLFAIDRGNSVADGFFEGPTPDGFLGCGFGGHGADPGFEVIDVGFGQVGADGHARLFLAFDHVEERAQFRMAADHRLAMFFSPRDDLSHRFHGVIAGLVLPRMAGGAMLRQERGNILIKGGCRAGQSCRGKSRLLVSVFPTLR